MTNNKKNRLDNSPILETIEKEISKIIKNTDFYKKYKNKVLQYYNSVFYKALLITGGYGIGKSKTLIQILEEENIEYLLFNEIAINTLKDAQSVFLSILNYSPNTFIVFDDIKLTRWVDYYILHLLNKKYPIAIILNSPEEIKRLDKIKGRLKMLELHMDKKDLEYLKKELCETFNIKLENEIILNVRDLVILIYSKLTGMKYDTTIEEILEEIDTRKRKNKQLQEILKKIKEKGLYIDDDLVVEIAVKILGYSEGTIRKNLKRYLVGL